MGTVMVTGAMLRCTFGDSISKFTATNALMLKVNGQTVGTVNDAEPMMNIAPFGMCKSLANPAVQSATAANFGVLTPMPCVPVTKRWIAAGTVVIDGKQVLTNECSMACSYGGKISIVNPGQMIVKLPS